MEVPDDETMTRFRAIEDGRSKKRSPTEGGSNAVEVEAEAEAACPFLDSDEEI